MITGVIHNSVFFSQAAFVENVLDREAFAASNDLGNRHYSLEAFLVRSSKRYAVGENSL